MNTTALTLSPQQERAAMMLAAGYEVKAVTNELGIHRSTLWQWRKQETFQAA